MFRSTRSLRSAAVAVVLAAATVAVPLLTASPASAQTTDVTCTPPRWHTSTYDPPLSVKSGRTTVRTRTLYESCVSSDPFITDGERSSAAKATLSCKDLLNPASVVFAIRWDSGAESIVQAEVQTSVHGEALISDYTGSVVAGEFTGDSFAQTAVGLSDDLLDCLLGRSSISRADSVVRLTITSA
jgi:hypothetical protein